MRDLAARLTALDPDAGAALQVIAYFDRLTEGRAGLQAIVRGAAVLAGCPARLADDQRRLHLRVHPDGTDATAGQTDPSWMSAQVTGTAVLWLERPGPPGPVDAMILERAAGAARTILDRARHHAPALLDLILDPAEPEHARLQAASRLGLTPHSRVRAIALADGKAHLMTESDPPLDPHQRAGVGPSVPIADLPTSHTAALVALRFTAEATERDPGPRVVHAEHLGGLAVLAAATPPGADPIPDVQSLIRAAATAPWALATLDAVADSPSLRTAATTLRVHHSTLQERLSHIDHTLGWDFRTPQGRLRLQLALALRRLTR